jgi:hypothetical protein
MMIRASASRLVGAVLAVIVSMTGAPLIAQLPDQPEHRWEVTHRADLSPEAPGLLEIVSGRLVFVANPPLGLWTWTIPLAELRAVKVKDPWVEIERQRARSFTDIHVQFRPRQGSAAQLAAEIERLAGDASILAAGSGLANIRNVMHERTSILVTRFDDTPLWTTETRDEVATRLVAGRGNGRPSLKRASTSRGFRLVGADLEFAPGSHRLSLAVLRIPGHVACTLEFEARPNVVYTLSKGPGNMPVLKEAATGESDTGRCVELPDDKRLSPLIIEGSGARLFQVDGWWPWVELGNRLFQNPEASPAGSKWIKGQLWLPPGRHTVDVGYRGTSGRFFLFDDLSLGTCLVEFTTEPSDRYHLRADITRRFRETRTFEWRALLQDDQKRTLANCGGERPAK